MNIVGCAKGLAGGGWKLGWACCTLPMVLACEGWDSSSLSELCMLLLLFKIIDSINYLDITGHVAGVAGAGLAANTVNSPKLPGPKVMITGPSD